MQKFKLIVTLLFLTLFINLHAQNNDSLLKSFELNIVKVKKDLNLIYYTPSKHGSYPTLIFINGNGSIPIFVDGNPMGFFPVSYFQKEFNIVVLSKPGVPVFVDSLNSPHLKITDFYKNYNYLDSTTYTYSASYTSQNNSDSLAARYAIAIDYVIKQPWHKNGNLFVFGHSQGAHVAAKLALKRQDKIRKVVVASSNANSRFHQFVRQTRMNVLYGQINGDDAQKYIDTIYSEYKSIFYADKNQKLDKLYDSDNFLSWYSVTKPSMKENLLQLKIPILCVYGTDDIGVLDNDYLMFDFIAKGKNNLQLKVYNGYDHNFFETVYDSNGNVIKNEMHWDKVFKDILNWLQK